MELGGALGSFVTWAVGWAVKFGAVAATLWAAWTMLKVLMAGGRGRAVWELVIGLATIAIVYAALKDLPGTLSLASGLGQQAWAAISTELRAGLS
jgi:hypothetical protein